MRRVDFSFIPKRYFATSKEYERFRKHLISFITENYYQFLVDKISNEEDAIINFMKLLITHRIPLKLIIKDLEEASCKTEQQSIYENKDDKAEKKVDKKRKPHKLLHEVKPMKRTLKNT